jgi:glycosyltransferase involved in cell wall biosynthesis
MPVRIFSVYNAKTNRKNFMQNGAVELSIIMPCLNEADSLPHCLTKAFSFLTSSKISGEIIVVDNGSIDDSAAIARKYNATVISEPERGYGNAIMTGIEHANGKYIIAGDADDSYDFSNLMPFVELLRQGHDLVIGNRFKGGIKKKAMPFLHRYIGNPILSFIGRWFFGIHIGDFHCGLRGIAKDSYNRLDLRTEGMEFASEMIVKAALSKMSVAETPVTLYPDKRKRGSHLRTWRDGWRHLRFLLLYSPQWLFLIPGLLLMLLGFAGTILLVSGPIQLGNKKLDVHTLVYTSGFILLGFQFISFYIFSRLYAATHGLWPGQEKFLTRFNKYFKLERGIFFGLLIFFAGLFLMFKSFLYWRHARFGNLDPVIVLRWVIPSVVLLVLGLQVIISFFYLSFLTIKSRRSRRTP